MEQPERLDKLLTNLGVCTRSEARAVCKAGRVRVNGLAVTDASVRVLPGIDSVTLDGKALTLQKHMYLMLNKPLGVVSATTDSRDKTVIDLVPQSLKRPGLFPAGRLDKDTTGFCLITDDGDFSHSILSPAHHVSKTYSVKLGSPLDYEKAAAEFKKGVVLGDGTVLLSARLFEASDGYYTVVIREGRYHQIRRMFASMGNEVTELKRLAIGGLKLDSSLLPGEIRPINMDEISEIVENDKGFDLP